MLAGHSIFRQMIIRKMQSRRGASPSEQPAGIPRRDGIHMAKRAAAGNVQEEQPDDHLHLWRGRDSDEEGHTGSAGELLCGERDAAGRKPDDGRHTDVFVRWVGRDVWFTLNGTNYYYLHNGRGDVIGLVENGQNQKCCNQQKTPHRKHRNGWFLWGEFLLCCI